MQYEVLRQRWKVIQYKNGAIYKTKKLDKVWIPLEDDKYGPDENDYVYTSLSTSEQATTATIRPRKDKTK